MTVQWRPTQKRLSPNNTLRNEENIKKKKLGFAHF